MGRRKTYRREDLVVAAQALFHAHGYAGTSTEQLVTGLGVNRNTMYSEFGSKRALFDEVLHRYDEHVATAIFGPLEADDAGLEAIDGLFDELDAGATSGRGLGCLLCNTAAELGGASGGGEPVVLAYFQRIAAAFEEVLARARAAGALAAWAQVHDEAAWLTATCLGIFVMVRAQAEPQVVRAAIRAARAHVSTLRASPS